MFKVLKSQEVRANRVSLDVREDSPPLSLPGKSSIYADSSTGALMVSINGDPYMELGGGGVTPEELGAVEDKADQALTDVGTLGSQVGDLEELVDSTVSVGTVDDTPVALVTILLAEGDTKVVELSWFAVSSAGLAAWGKSVVGVTRGVGGDPRLIGLTGGNEYVVGGDDSELTGINAEFAVDLASLMFVCTGLPATDITWSGRLTIT